jgi:tetratricopeptide (TPR) repeat protein
VEIVARKSLAMTGRGPSSRLWQSARRSAKLVANIVAFRSAKVALLSLSESRQYSARHQTHQENLMRPTCLTAILLILFCTAARADDTSVTEVKAWEGTLTLPTYTWENDINPKFWALELGTKMAPKGGDPAVYPYVMQDQLSRTKVDRTYKALYLENEYLKVTCLPELGGRLHSVLDKTTGKEMFHKNDVIKPGMIAIRGAWISGGVEWNTGPHGHTATVLSPVSALTGRNRDGSAYLEISNTEQIFRTQWTVRVTLHPAKAYLDEQIRIYNPTDGMHPYYFWNCTAFPNKPGTRFIFPMSLGTDHNAKEFFNWPIHEGRDLSWLKNYPMYSSIFAVNCTHDFFGAYDVDADRGIVQAADHNQLIGKKAWTWGEWEFGKTAEKNLADGDAHYIEVQSGPLPTQSDYGMLSPHDQVSWQEYWYPIHGLGDGFEFANQNAAMQTKRKDGKFELRIFATASFPKAVCELKQGKKQLLRKEVDLSPNSVTVVTLEEQTSEPIEVSIQTKTGKPLAAFASPLPISKVEPPVPNVLAEKSDDQLSIDELCLKARKIDRGTDRKKARELYEKVLVRDPGHVLALRSLAVLDYEAGLYGSAIEKLTKAVSRDSDDGLCWYYLGLSRYHQGDFNDALRCACRAVRCPGTASLGYDLIGRAQIRLGNNVDAAEAFVKALKYNAADAQPSDHSFLTFHKEKMTGTAEVLIDREIIDYPSRLIPRAIRGLNDSAALARFAQNVRTRSGDSNFEALEASLTFADLGMFNEARQIVYAVCVDGVPKEERSFLPLYYLAYFFAKCNDSEGAHRWLEEAAATVKPFVFASRVEELDILGYAVKENPKDAQAHLQLGCLLANLGRVEEAVPEWAKAAELDPKSSIAWRNLGLAAAVNDDAPKAEEYYRKAIAARPSDQTLYRDLARILISVDRRPDAVVMLEQMPFEGVRRAEITMILAESYLLAGRYDDCVKILEAAPYFVNWEGNDDTWRLFNRAHVERGRQRLEKGELQAALADFEAALTYPANLNVGRSDKPEEAEAQYYRGKALAAMGKLDDARVAWKAGAKGFDGVKPSLESTIPILKSTQKEFHQKCIDALAK